MSRPRPSGLVGVLALGWLVTLGGAFGITAFHLASNRYLGQGLHLLALDSLRRSLTLHALVFLVAAATLGILSRGGARILGRRAASGSSWPLTFAVALPFAVLVTVFLFDSFHALDFVLRMTAPVQEYLKHVPVVRGWLAEPSSRKGLVALVGGAAALIGLFALRTLLVRRPGIGARLVAVGAGPLPRRAAVVLLGCLLVLDGFWAAFRHARADRGPNVLLVTIDTLRADRLRDFGARRNTAPQIGRLAERGITFEHAVSQAPWTLPSMATLHTGLYPSAHGAVNYRRRFGDDLTTLAELFRNRLYETVAVVSHHFVGRSYGFAQGFDVFDQQLGFGHSEVSSPELTERAVRYLRERRDRPFFLWVHYFDPHHTYLRHPEFGYADGYDGPVPPEIDIHYLLRNGSTLGARDIRHVLDVYDEEISFTDRHLGRLLDELEALGLADETAVVVTADHGEEFRDHGAFGHPPRLYEELIRVPLVVVDPTSPELTGVRVPAPVEVRAVGRTILEICGIPSASFAGSDLRDVALGGVPPERLFSQATSAWQQDVRKDAIVSDGWKLIRDLRDGSLELYDLRRDPAEQDNRIHRLDDEQRPRFEELRRALSAFEREPRARTPRVRLGPEERRRLEALGYVD